MKNKIITSAFLLIMIPMSFINAQWEKIPIYGGHATKLIQNKFGQNKIFALTSRSGLFYSSNAGLSWESKNGLNNEITGLSIFDLEVTNNNSLFIVTQDDETGERKFYSSTNFGVSWEVLPPPEQTGASIYSDFESLSDGTLYLFTCPELFKSTDYGINWLKIPIPAIANQGTRYFYINEINPKQIMISGYNGLLVMSTDDGMNWNIANSFPASSIVYRPKEFIEKGQLYYSTWVHSSVGNNYFISTDSGRVWIQRNSNSIIGNITAPKIIPLDSSHVFTVLLNTLYFTTDAGLTWQKRGFTDQKIWDAIISNGIFLGSFNTIGIQRSNDSGVTWKSSTIGFAAFYEIDFSLLDSSTYFAIVTDGGSELKQTTDEGMTWTTLYNVGQMTQLQTATLPEVRYYLIQNDNTLISGVIGQNKPDTLLHWNKSNQPPTLVSQYVDFKISPINTNVLFIMIFDSLGRRILRSSNSGKDWDQIYVMQYSYRYFEIYPSRVNEKRIFGVGGYQMSTQTAGIGLWRCDNIGDQWNWIDRYDPGTWNSSIRLFDLDMLFHNDRFAISEDLGEHWNRNENGIDSSQIGEHFTVLNNGEHLLIANDILYNYKNAIWHSIREKRGLNVTKESPNRIFILNQDIYASFPYDALYVLRNGLTSTVQIPRELLNLGLSQNYPNPFSDKTAIRYSVPVNSNAFIIITDILGRRIRTININSGNAKDNFYIWDRRDENGVKVPNGIYIYNLTNIKQTITHKMIILE